MLMPQAAKAQVSAAKIVDYLLSMQHPTGMAKAHFFASLGFGTGQWRELRASLLVIARTTKVAETVANAFGMKYIIHGMLTGPDGRQRMITTVWFRGTNAALPQLVTAYPAKIEKVS